MNLSETYALFAVMKAVHPNHPTPDETVRAYAELLKDLAFDDARAAVMELLQTSAFFPKPAEIIQGAHWRATLPSPDDAWAEVERALLHNGALHPQGVARHRAPWSHPAIGQTLSGMPRWRERWLFDNPASLEAEFRTVYRDVTRTKGGLDAPPVNRALSPGLE